MQTTIKKLFLFSLTLTTLFLDSTPFKLQAVTWAPPVDLNFMPSTSSLNGEQSLSGNTVITWLDGPSNNYLTSFYLVGAASWSAPKILVSAALLTNPPSVAINASGDAVATWIQNGTVQTIESARFVEDAWVSLGTVGSPAAVGFIFTGVDIDPFGNILTTYIQDNGDTTNTLFAANNIAGSWTVPQVLFDTGLTMAIHSGPPFTMTLGATILQSVPTLSDNQGNGQIIWVTSDGVTITIYSSVYTRQTNTYSPAVTIFSAPGNINNLYASISGSGNAVASWIINNTDLYSSVFTPASGWTSPVLLWNLSNVNNILTSVNDAGNAVAAFDSSNSAINVSSFVNGIWSTVVVAPPQAGFMFTSPVVAIDPFGNALSVWASLDTLTNMMHLESSSRIGLTGAWSAPAPVPFPSFAGTLDSPVRMMITSEELAVLAVLVFEPPLFTDIEIILGFNLFPPQPVRHFRGKVIKNRFLTDTDIVHHLTWRASLSPTVTEYKLFRNGKYIAKIRANKNLVYNDHNRKGKDRYTLVAVSGGGISTPVTVKVP